jgi:transcriptional regulator with XRE-family HTH domain
MHRAKLGLTQAQVAAKSGLPLRTYRRFESSGCGNVQTLYAVAAAFGRAKIIEHMFGTPTEHIVRSPAPAPPVTRPAPAAEEDSILMRTRRGGLYSSSPRRAI